MKDVLLEQVRSILTEVLGDSVTALEEENLNREHLPAWDSLRHMELILRLEEQFDVRFSIREASIIQSLNDIVGIVGVKR